MMPQTPSPLALIDGAIADPAQRALTKFLAIMAALFPPGILEALAAAAAGVVAETQQLAMRAAESEAARERERDNEIATLRVAAQDAEAARDNERAARLAAEDAVRVLQARNAGLRRAVADIGARAEMVLASDAETPAAAQAQADDGGRDADVGERPSPSAIPKCGNDRKQVCHRDPPFEAAAVDGPGDRIGGRTPRPEATAPQ